MIVTVTNTSFASFSKIWGEKNVEAKRALLHITIFASGLTNVYFVHNNSEHINTASERCRRRIHTLGVTATSQILMGDCQKLSFSTLTKVPSWFFDQINSLYAQALPGLPAQFCWALSYLKNFCIFKILVKNRSKYQSPSQIQQSFIKSGNP